MPSHFDFSPKCQGMNAWSFCLVCHQRSFVTDKSLWRKDILFNYSKSMSDHMVATFFLSLMPVSPLASLLPWVSVGVIPCVSCVPNDPDRRPRRWKMISYPFSFSSSSSHSYHVSHVYLMILTNIPLFLLFTVHTILGFYKRQLCLTTRQR